MTDPDPIPGTVQSHKGYYIGGIARLRGLFGAGGAVLSPERHTGARQFCGVESFFVITGYVVALARGSVSAGNAHGDPHMMACQRMFGNVARRDGVTSYVYTESGCAEFPGVPRWSPAVRR